jgi:hypothetical protein
MVSSAVKGFVFFWTKLGLYLPLEKAFFETARVGKGFYHPNFQVPNQHFTVPVIAIFTKFNDLMTQIYNIDQDDDVNRQIAENIVEILWKRSSENQCTGISFDPVQMFASD